MPMELRQGRGEDRLRSRNEIAHAQFGSGASGLTAHLGERGVIRGEHRAHALQQRVPQAGGCNAAGPAFEHCSANFVFE